jgi:arylsulfatase A
MVNKEMVIRNIRVYAAASMLCTACLLQSCASKQEAPQTSLPNIVLIFADDMGYGDVSALNPDARTQTPAIDRLVREGISFSNAHASASVCTPSRYGLLTGRYAFRSAGGAYGIWGFDKPVMEPGRETLASLLKKAGYTTACIGKWHLGLGWQTKDSSEKAALDPKTGFSNVDYTQKVANGPNDYGFDYSFIHPASLDIPPYVFLRNHQVVDPDVVLTTEVYPARLENTRFSWDKKHTDDLAVYWEKGVWWRQGEMSRSFRIEECHPAILKEGIAFIEKQAREKPDNPFFLYLPLTGPHTPWVPTGRFKGTSPIGLYGDFVSDIDAVVEQVKETLVNHNLDQNTIVIFASDNGAYWPQEEIDLHKHDSNGSRRGQKGDIWEGGHRVPLVISWPAHVKPAGFYKHLVSLTDIFATLADLTGQKKGSSSGEDSFSFLPVLNGDLHHSTRSSMIHHSSRGMYSVRSDEWKYIEGLGSGGFTAPYSEEAQPGAAQGQLYHLTQDSLEGSNLYLRFPDKVTDLSAILQKAKEYPQMEVN